MSNTIIPVPIFIPSGEDKPEPPPKCPHCGKELPEEKCDPMTWTECAWLWSFIAGCVIAIAMLFMFAMAFWDACDGSYRMDLRKNTYMNRLLFVRPLGYNAGVFMCTEREEEKK